MSGLFKKKKKQPPKKAAETPPIPEPPDESEAIYDDGDAESEDVYAVPEDEGSPDPPQVPPSRKKQPSPPPEEETYEAPDSSSNEVSDENGSDGRPALPLPPRPSKEDKKKTALTPKPVLSPKPVPPVVKERKNPPQPDPPTKSPVSNGTEVITFKNNNHVDDDEECCYTDAVSLRLSVFDWFHGDISREEGQKRVKSIGKDGAFLLRTSTKSPSQPYTLVLLYKDRVNNLKVRKRSDGKFALGEEKQNEISFDDEKSIIEYHKKNAVTLTGTNPGETTLSDCPDGKTVT